jgi:hypothetical protein
LREGGGGGGGGGGKKEKRPVPGKAIKQSE